MKSKIYEFRMNNSWNLKQLSRLSGVTVNTLWRMEKGYGTTLRNAFKVADAFQVTIYELWSISPSGGETEAHDSNDYEKWSIRDLREKRGWRLQDLAELCGVSKSTVAAIENGRVPTLKNAVQIASAFGLSVYQIWGQVQ